MLSKVTILTSMTSIKPMGGDIEPCIAIRKVKKPNGTWFIQEVYRPEIFAQFEKYMGGVD